MSWKTLGPKDPIPKSHFFLREIRKYLNFWYYLNELDYPFVARWATLTPQLSGQQSAECLSPFPTEWRPQTFAHLFSFLSVYFSYKTLFTVFLPPPSHKGKWPRLSFCRALGNPDAPALWPTVCGTPKPFSHWMPTSNVRTSRVTFCCNNYAFYIIFKIH